ncbi:MAG: hypothetical protein JST14_00080 [Bacteroidetes bacterium]|nr:hypothetical protein [Bacteroidota bacterium]
MEQFCLDKGVSEFGCACISWGLYLMYFLGGAAVLSLIVLPVMNALKNPKEIIGSAIGILALIVLFGISYALSGDEVTLKYSSLGVDASSSKLIGAGLIMFYIVLVIAVVGFIVSSIRKSVL